jgi:hypothetical protein
MLVVETPLSIEAAVKALREVCDDVKALREIRDEFKSTPVELKCRISGLRLLGFAGRWGPTTMLQLFPEEAVSEGEYSMDVAKDYLEERRGEVESSLRLLAERLDASFAAVSPYPLSFFAAEFEGTLQERMLEDPCDALPVLLKQGVPSMLAYVLLSLLNAREGGEGLVKLLDLDYEHLRRLQMQVKCIGGQPGCVAATEAQLAEELAKTCNGRIKVIA